MHARMATFEGGGPDQVREMVDQIERRSSVEMYEVGVKIDA